MDIKRVVMIGDSSVGKTSLVCALFEKAFNTGYQETIGAAFHTFSSEEKPGMQMQIWDTAGQERYRALGPVYYRNTSAAILVYDCSRVFSLPALNEWLTAFRDVVGLKIPVFIVANKIDLFETEPESIAEGERWAESQGLRFIKASAKTGYNVKMLFEKVLDVICSLRCADEAPASMKGKEMVTPPPKKSQCSC